MTYAEESTGKSPVCFTTATSFLLKVEAGLERYSFWATLTSKHASSMGKKHVLVGLDAAQKSGNVTSCVFPAGREQQPSLHTGTHKVSLCFLYRFRITVNRTLHLHTLLYLLKSPVIACCSSSLTFVFDVCKQSLSATINRLSAYCSPLNPVPDLISHLSVWQEAAIYDYVLNFPVATETECEITI